MADPSDGGAARCGGYGGGWIGPRRQIHLGRRYREGITQAPIDLVQSEATVATRQQELIYARNAAANSEDDLKARLGFDLPHEWEVRVETTDSYDMDPVLPNLQESIDVALEKRPAILRQELELLRFGGGADPQPDNGIRYRPTALRLRPHRAQQSPPRVLPHPMRPRPEVCGIRL